VPNHPTKEVSQAVAVVNLYVTRLLAGKVLYRFDAPPKFLVGVDVRVIKPTVHLVSLLLK
jgi:hypothetical protein